MIESIESKTPPRPGIKVPLSFISAERLNTDSVKSPTIETTAVKKLIIIIFQYSLPKISGKIKFNKIPHAIEVIIPPINPTKLLLGLAGINPRVDFPKSIPKNHAPESHINTRIKNKIKKYVEFGRVVNFTRNVSKYPQ